MTKGLCVSLSALALALTTSVAQASDACWPGTSEKPLESELIFSTSGGSLVDVLRKVYWDEFEKECGVKVVS